MSSYRGTSDDAAPRPAIFSEPRISFLLVFSFGSHYLRVKSLDAEVNSLISGGICMLSLMWEQVRQESEQEKLHAFKCPHNSVVTNAFSFSFSFY